jgi:hypothetical protein
LDTVPEVEFTITISHTGWFHAVIVFFVPEGIGQVKVLAVFGTTQDLLSKVLVDHGSLERKTFRSVHEHFIFVFGGDVSFLDGCGWGVGCFVDG